MSSVQETFEETVRKQGLEMSCNPNHILYKKYELMPDFNSELCIGVAMGGGNVHLSVGHCAIFNAIKCLMLNVEC